MTFILPSFGASAIAAVPGGSFTNDYSLSYDGSDDYARATGLGLSGATSFSMWFNAQASVTNYPLMYMDTNGLFIDISSGNLRCILYDNASGDGSQIYKVNGATGGISVGTWFHLAVTTNGTSTLKLYVNGVEKGAGSPLTYGSNFSSFNAPSSLPIDIGAKTTGTYAQQLIDEVAIFGSELSATNISDIYNSGVPTDISSLSPKHWWRMGDSDTGVSNGSSTPTIVSNVGNSSAIQNHYSLDFDGSNDYLSLGNLGTAGRSFGAISMWLNATNQIEAGNGSNLGYIFGFNASTDGTDVSTQWDGLQYGYFSGAGDIISLRIGGAIVMKWTVSSGDKLPVGWHHIVVTHNGTGYTLYVDGIIATSNALGGSITTLTTAILSGTSFDSFRMGAKGYGSSSLYPFQGLIDEVALFDSALSSSNVTSIYNSGVPADIGSGGLNLNPTGWWRMGDGGTWNGSNWSIPDASANSNTGTSVNMVEVDRVTDTPTANAILKNGPTYSTNVPT